MGNQFVQYPLYIYKTANGYEVCHDPSDAPQFKYIFANMADMTYWMGLNEQAAPDPAP